MQTQRDAVWLEQQIDQWRSYLRRRPAIPSVDVAKLEEHLRGQLARLADAGLATDEAFLVAVKRMGELDVLSREYAREHSERLWRQLMVFPSDTGASHGVARTGAIVAFCLAVLAAALVKLPALFRIPMDDLHAGFYFRNASFFVLPVLTGYFAWKRQLDARAFRWLAAALAAAVVIANVYPVATKGSTELLMSLHLPITLWLVVGIAYAGGRWSQVAGRMDFIRFSGELFIYFALMALGGGVLTAFVGLFFRILGMDPHQFIGSWLVPCGAAGAVVVGSWLAEAKQGVIDNMAPVLTRLFTPLFAAVLLTFLGGLLWTGRGIHIERDMLIAFDLLLVVVLGLLLYSISARSPGSPQTAFDFAVVVLLISALLVDSVTFWAISTRITEFGFSPNRVAVLGVNLILLVNLAWSAVLYLRFLRGRGSFTSLEKWQTDYLPVYAAWAAMVVTLFPPMFRYI